MERKRWYRNMAVAALLAVLVVVAWWNWWSVAVTTVYVVRHAEKLNTTQDTPLSPAGEARAQELAHVLQDAGIDAVFVTQWQRTQLTGAPTASAAGVTPVEYPDPVGVVATVMSSHIGEQVLIVGHSNTVDDIVAELGVAGLSDLSEPQFDRLFVVTKHGDTAHLARLRYGLATP